MKRRNHDESEKAYLLVVRPEDPVDNKPHQYVAIYRTKEEAQKGLKLQKIKEIEDFLNYIYYPDHLLNDTKNQHKPGHIVLQHNHIDNPEDDTAVWEKKWVNFCNLYTRWERNRGVNGKNRWFYHIKQSVIDDDFILDEVFNKVFNLYDDKNYRVIISICAVPYG
jgi:hypothetical protein